MSLLIKLFIKDNENVSAPSVKKAYAELSSIVGIVLNSFLCITKVIIGFFSHSIAISADGFNNLSDAGTSLVSLLGFKIAKYGGGNVHPFGHGRIEWIMGIFTSIAVLFMGIQLADSSIETITNPEKFLFSPAIIVVLILSIFVKGYMYLYNKNFSQITDSETLKATATDCISDCMATFAVLLSTIVSQISDWQIDGYCGVFVSVFIIISGAKSLWEILGRIMGKSADQNTINFILQMIHEYPEIVDVPHLMLHDYGFSYFVISMNITGYKKDSEQLYIAIKEISHLLDTKFHCDCFIQIDYLMNDEELAQKLIQKIQLVLQKYSDGIYIRHFRLIESGTHTNIAFDLIYPADLQNKEEKIRQEIETIINSEYPQYYTTIKSMIRRERFRLGQTHKTC
ncbi:MAG: cation diffusion facilitator family transporter [Lachnospiraceae bacterium]|nr:cation diffusion facilitator family transporter [Lachnospiraceae bacterium]